MAGVPTCPSCGGVDSKQISLNYVECTSVRTVNTTDYIPDANQPGAMIPIFGESTVSCNQRFHIGSEPASTLQCRCGTFAIGLCAVCSTPVCGDHSAMGEVGRLCADDLERESIARTARGRTEREAKNRAAESARNQVRQAHLDRPVMSNLDLASWIDSRHAASKGPFGFFAEGSRLQEFSPSELASGLARTTAPLTKLGSGFNAVKAWHVGLDEWKEQNSDGTNGKSHAQVCLVTSGEIVRVSWGGRRRDKSNRLGVSPSSAVWKPSVENVAALPDYLFKPVLTGAEEIAAWRAEFYKGTPWA